MIELLLVVISCGVFGFGGALLLLIWRAIKTAEYLETTEYTKLKAIASAAYAVVYGGEFADWTVGKEMPLAAAKEFDELYNAMSDYDPQVPPLDR